VICFGRFFRRLPSPRDDQKDDQRNLEPQGEDKVDIHNGERLPVMGLLGQAAA
jgi:hypothetical protein